MKLATYRNHTRDGQLMVVSRDLTRAIAVPHIAASLQAALDDWSRCEPALQEIYAALNQGTVNGAVSFDQSACHSPLPRAYQWADGSAYLNHVELVRKARGAEVPASFYQDPLMYQGGSDTFLPPHADIPLADVSWGLDFEGEVAVITDDVPLGSQAGDCAAHIRLLMLVNDVTLRNLIPAELAKGFGFFQSKPATAFSPVAVTPDELGQAWQDSKVHLPLRVEYNGKLYGQPQCGVEMQFNFAQLVAHVAKTRALAAGSIVGSGTISNHDRATGSCCLAEQRMIEIIEQGAPVTPFMQPGDRIRIEMLDAAGQSIFGCIDQQVAAHD
ncbi:fumarylacetoacetate hydrolase family protein [Aquitalea sp. USM4]|uniref:fumarylacetoacetate hydrolase family protein n=1 Tax=Aquitalea sp. USM4 TaxID=1590041 RepID=UPI00103D6DC9|nr:fumarylacetoacetate hydrolase family protein [Aquitalea sp. USM4]QBJ78444.1 2-keto-4-pentenoate hydratase [Aquitalea sp. USM4]